MLDIKKAHVERKLLTEPCWIELADGIRLRIDYLTRSQETELRRLRIEWQYQHSNPENDHWIEYYVRAAVKEVEGFTIDDKASKLETKGGLARDLVAEADKLDFVQTLAAYGLLEAVFGLIYERLKVTEMEKKTSPLPQASLSAVH